VLPQIVAWKRPRTKERSSKYKEGRQGRPGLCFEIRSTEAPGGRKAKEGRDLAGEGKGGSGRALSEKPAAIKKIIRKDAEKCRLRRQKKNKSGRNVLEKKT